MNDGIDNKESRKVHELLTNKTLEIPTFQRKYSWKKKHVKALFEDVWSFFLEEYEQKTADESDDAQVYFLGAIYTYSTKDTYQIVDGQQRLSTWLLYTLAMVESLSNTENNSVQKWISKMKNSPFYKKVECVRAYSKWKKKDIPQQNKSITEAYNWCKNTINAWLDEIKKEGSEIEYISTIEDFFRFCWKKVGVLDIHLSESTCIESFFKTLNSKGSSLKSADLIHTEITELLKVEGNKDLSNYYESTFNEIIDTITTFENNNYKKSKKSGEIIADFFRFFVAHVKHELYPLNSLAVYFEFIKYFEDKDKCNSNINELMEKIKGFLSIYKFFMTANEDKLGYGYLYIRSTSMNTYLPLLASIYDIIYNDKNTELSDLEKEEDLKKSIEVLVLYDFSRVLIRKGRAEAVKSFPKFKDQIMSFVKKSEYTIFPLNRVFIKFLAHSTLEEKTTAWDIITKKEQFKELFLSEDLYDRERAKTRGIIYSIASAIQRGGNTPMEKNSYYSVEHLIPQDLSNYRKKIESEEEREKIAALKHKIGNLIIISKNKNSKLKNKWIDKKMDILKEDESITYNKLVIDIIEKKTEKITYEDFKQITRNISELYLSNFQKHILDYDKVYKVLGQ